MSEDEREIGYYDGYNLESDERPILKKALSVYKKEGFFTLIRKIFTYVIHIFTYVIHKLNYEVFNKYFELDGRKYKYFIHLYNAVNSERVVEVSYVMDFLKRNDYEHKRVLEVGNVLTHYFKFKHDIVDKYEKESYVKNIDIIDYNPIEKYDMIISISTVEHIGFDEPIKEYGKSKKAIQKIIDLLDDKGLAVITVPIRYNLEIDAIIKNNEINFTQRSFLKRISKLNLWKQTTMDDSLKYKYGSKYPAANSIAILLYKR